MRSLLGPVVLIVLALLLAALAAYGQVPEIGHVPPAVPGPLAPELAQDAAAFFRSARKTCDAAHGTLEAIQHGLYVTGIAHGAVGAGVLVLIAFLIFGRQPTPKP